MSSKERPTKGKKLFPSIRRLVDYHVLLISFDYVLAYYGGKPFPPYVPLWHLRTSYLSPPLRRFSSRPSTLEEVFNDGEYNLLTWTRAETYGSIYLMVDELNGIVSESNVIFGIGGHLMLVVHNRGGLVAGERIQDHPSERWRGAGLIQLACLNRGSRVADMADFLAKRIKVIG